MGVTEDEILAALLALLPPGDALPQDAASALATLLRPTARALEAVEGLAEFVLADLDPRETTSFLEDWERVLGLPDCGTLAGSQPERRAEVVEKYSRLGDLTAQSLIDAAALLGFTITITEPQAAPDEHVFDVNLPALEVVYFRASESRTGEPLGSFGDPRLTCLLNARKPAHLNFDYTPPPP